MDADPGAEVSAEGQGGAAGASISCAHDTADLTSGFELVARDGSTARG